MTDFVRDNDHTGPLRIITSVECCHTTMIDNESYQQIIRLSCGHWCYNTYGHNSSRFDEGQHLQCRTCGINEQKKKI